VRRSTEISCLLGLLAGLGCSSGDDDASADLPRQSGGGFLFGEEGSLPGDPGQRPTCLGQTREAESIELDIYVMLDISGSMLDVLPQSPGTTKWDAVRRSLAAFVQAPETADIGIGIQYFPLINQGVPFSCAVNDDCGAGGPCTSSVCVEDVTEEVGGAVGEVTYVAPARDGNCGSDEDCPGAGERCRNMLGVCVIPGDGVPNLDGLPLCNASSECEGVPGTECEEIGVCQNLVDGELALCTPSLGCPPGGGACSPFPYGCQNQTVCDAADYATPAVPISLASTRATDIIASLDAQVPNGLTPTGPALGGALVEAREWAAQNPGRQVLTVLATDGLPTECTPLDFPDITQLAADANSGNAPVRTFVIGVFGASDLGADGRDNLDALARAGGSNEAFVINTAGDVSQDFLDALNEIRDSAVSCEFQLDAEASLDLGRVNLRMSDPSGAVIDLSNVGAAAACGEDQGWYYVTDANGVPRQISVCPRTCDEFRSEGIRAELEIGCATRLR
jgi:hypothetical protein